MNYVTTPLNNEVTGACESCGRENVLLKSAVVTMAHATRISWQIVEKVHLICDDCSRRWKRPDCKSCGRSPDECPDEGRVCPLHGDCGCTECRFSPQESLG